MKKASAETLIIFLIAMGLAACDQQPSNPQPSTSSSSTPVQATQPADHAAQAVDSATPASANVMTINTSCPVSGDKIDPQVRTITYKGQTYGFCCDDCVDAFKANPAKYAIAQ